MAKQVDEMDILLNTEQKHWSWILVNEMKIMMMIIFYVFIHLDFFNIMFFLRSIVFSSALFFYAIFSIIYK